MSQEYEFPIEATSRILLRSGHSVLASGLFTSGLMAMLDLGRPLPADDHRASKILHINVRTYRKALTELLADGTFVRLPSGEVTAPIIKLCRPVKRCRTERPQRDAIPRDTRAAVLAKTGGKCAYCAVDLTDDAQSPTSYEPDHVLPVVLGGADDVGNLIPSCRSCNRKKKDKPFLAFVGREDQP